ncbi:MAG TPA: hypothetical protein QF625_01190 [Candidatus Scalindua sp.]|jgi:hypothetical protein|nr:hypothetical protein [Candidatus Scalindua sp.]|tara:strand:+ start:395 stop:547 length:153 start_codon:yes stop_codon:yes gene_type:complete
MIDCILIPKLSDFTLYAIVAEGFSLRFATFEGIMQVTQPEGCGYKIARFR